MRELHPPIEPFQPGPVPEAKPARVPDAGHSAMERGIGSEIVDVTDHFATT